MSSGCKAEAGGEEMCEISACFCAKGDHHEGSLNGLLATGFDGRQQG